MGLAAGVIACAQPTPRAANLGPPPPPLASAAPAALPPEQIAGSDVGRAPAPSSVTPIAPSAPPPPPPLASPRLIPGRHAPSGLTRPAKPVRIAPGFYECKVDDLYKLRSCKVDRDEAGRTWLEVLPGNLLPMRGLLEEEKGDLVFEGFPTEPVPFGCYRCSDACEDPQSPRCECTEAQLLGARTCQEQVLRVRFRGNVGALRGAMTHDLYFQSVDEARRPKAFDVQVNKYNVTLGRRLVEDRPATLVKRLPGGGVLIGD